MIMSQGCIKLCLIKQNRPWKVLASECWLHNSVMELLPNLYGVRVTFPIPQNKQNADSAGEMTQCIKVLADKPDSFGLIPGTHVVEEENQLPQVVFWVSHESWGMQVYKDVHAWNKFIHETKRQNKQTYQMRSIGSALRKKTANR